MKHWLIGAAVAALAFAPLAAQGNGHGKGNGGGRGNAAHGPKMQGPATNGPSMASAAHGKAGHSAGSMASAMEAAAPQHGQGRGKGQGSGNAHANGNGPAKAKSSPGNAGQERGRAAAAPGNSPPRQEAQRGNGSDNRHGNGNAHPSAVAAESAKSGVKVLQDGRHYYTRREAREPFSFASVRRGPIDGCPPGLAKKNNGCQPPGQARRNSYGADWWGLSALAGAPYLYDDGYLLRLNGDSVASYVPLLGGALSVGNVWPATYAPAPVPDYYADYYDLGPPNSYRYADDVLYRVDPSTSAITSIAALLTGDNFEIGGPVPAGYDVYNVPYPYRDQYVDGPHARYRYSDGYIYQIDPTTQLVTAAIDLLAG
jgi:hypothetical protein